MPARLWCRCHRSVRGFTYLGVLLFVAVLAVVAGGSVTWGQVMHRRMAEEALLETGAAFGEALRGFARATPQGQPQSPKTLDDLLRDPRFPGTVRHLRKVFADPMTGSATWGLARDPSDGGIVAVFSLSCAKPIKIGNFDARFANFAGRTIYRDWKFVRPAEPGPPGDGLRKGLIDPRQLLAEDDSGSEAPEAPEWLEPDLPPCEKVEAVRR